MTPAGINSKIRRCSLRGIEELALVLDLYWLFYLFSCPSDSTLFLYWYFVCFSMSVGGCQFYPRK